MDLRIPYTFYPTALPAWMAWMLFLTASVAGVALGFVRGSHRGWRAGLLTGIGSSLALLAATIVASMFITFFVHDV